jgi:hypothetical protein|tara:strand:+ start:200 stop:358 length:159 start_codon:yes stop_codon:yes gene_type:complete
MFEWIKKISWAKIIGYDVSAKAPKRAKSKKKKRVYNIKGKKYVLKKTAKKSK